MPKRLFWTSSGYVAGAASSWWVQRKVRRAADRVLPSAVRNEIVTRAGRVSRETVARTRDNRAIVEARRAWRRVRPAHVDLREESSDAEPQGWARGRRPAVRSAD